MMLSQVIASQIRRIMGERDLSQKELVNYLNENEIKVSQSGISKILKGKQKNIRLDMLFQIANFLGTTVEMLTNPDDQPPSQQIGINAVAEPRIDYIAKTDTEKKIIMLIKSMDDEEQRMAFKLLRALSE